MICGIAFSASAIGLQQTSEKQQNIFSAYFFVKFFATFFAYLAYVHGFNTKKDGK